MQARHIPAHGFVRQRWKNRLGWTFEIAREPAPGNGTESYAWRASIAEIEQDCSFSAFPGLRRCLVLLTGAGMRLTDTGQVEHEILPPHGRIEFDGAHSMQCVLFDGPTRDFNLIWDPKQVEASVHLRPLVGPMLFFPALGSRWLILQLSGHSQLKQRGIALQAGDALLLSADSSAAERCILEGSGELLVSVLRPLADELP